MTWWRVLGASVAGMLVLLAIAWLARAQLAGRVAEAYFRSHGIASSIQVSRLGLSGLTGRVVLGRPDAPAFSADAVEVRFDPLSIMPRIVDVRLVHPVIRARLDGLGRVSLPALQNWIDSLSKNAAPRTRWVSDDLPVSLSGLRILLETLGGPLDLSGDARIVRGALVQAALTARPSAMGYNGIAIRLTDARLTFETAIGAYRISARFAGDVKAAGLEAKAMAIRFVSDDVQWDPASKSLATPSARLTLSAQGLEVSGFATKAPAFDAIAEYLRLSFAQSMPAGGLHLRLKGGAGFSPEALLRRFPVLAREKKLAGAIRTNLTRLDVDADVDATLAKDGFGLRSGAPLLLSGARGAVLTVSRMALQKNGGSLSGAAALALHGGGFPEISLDGQGRRAADGSMGGDGTIRVKGDYDMLRGGDLAARGAVTARGGRFAFTAADCARITLAQLRSGTGDLANGISGSVCPSGEAMIVSDAGGWSFNAMARGAAMTLPQAPAVVDKAEAKIAFHGDARDFGGKIAVLAAHVTDKAPALRFHPLDATGDIALNKGIWRGGFAVAGPHNSALGTAHFTHAMASGVGDARINITHLEFAPGKLQPTMLSPLLGAVREVNGVARLDGVVNWRRDAIDSRGTLDIEKLDFLTPLGTAHAVSGTIALKSLLPPATEPGQHLAIARIDWTLPFSGVAVDFSLASGSLQVNSIRTGFAEGQASLGGFNIDLSRPPNIAGTAKLDGIALAPLVTATNLGSKLKLEGKVTGNVPFSAGPNGIRITKGHLQSDSPGRLSLNRSIWTQDNTIATNAVQDLAYQALEYLSFDSLSADIDSVDKGRLQVVFHIKGHSDPPTRQEANIAIADLIDGTALSKAIPLPSGTPIDLTLDTSLNFDELLKSYAEAWSNSHGERAGANP